MQVDHAVLGDDVVHVAARGHDACTRLEHGHDARDLTARRGGGQGDDGLTALGKRRAADEVHLAADARVDLVAYGVRAHLTAEVDLERCVDRADLVVLANQGRVVRSVAGMKLDEQVVVHELEQARRARDEARHRAAWVHLLLLVRDDAALDQRDQPIGEHLGVHAELELVAEQREHRIGNAADTHLQRGAILDQLGDMLADLALDRPRCAHGPRMQRSVRMDERAHPSERHHRVAQGARHLLVDLGDDHRGRVGRRLGSVDGGAEGAVAVGIRR